MAVIIVPARCKKCGSNEAFWTLDKFVPGKGYTRKTFTCPLCENKHTQNYKNYNRPSRIYVKHLSGNKVAVIGHTYDVKESLKKLGLRWNSETKHWFKDCESEKEVIELEEKLRKI